MQNDPGNPLGNQNPVGRGFSQASPTHAMEQGTAQGTRVPPSTPSAQSRSSQLGPNTPEGANNVRTTGGSSGMEPCRGVPNLPPGFQVTGVAAQSFQQPFGNQQGMGITHGGGFLHPQFPCQAGNAPAVMPGSIQDVMRMASNMNSAQVMTLAQFFQEQVRSRAAVIPEVFGQINSVPAEPFMPDLMAAGLPVPAAMIQEGSGSGQQSQEGNRGQLDVFSRSEKWLGTPPQPDVSKWTSRESEVLGLAQYVADLSSWASQASLDSTEFKMGATYQMAINDFVNEESFYETFGNSSKYLHVSCS